MVKGGVRTSVFKFNIGWGIRGVDIGKEEEEGKEDDDPMID